MRSPWVEAFWQAHKRLYRWSNGRIGARMANLPVLLLETVGRRTATPRTNALTFLPWRDAFVVVASCLGEPKHPGWYHNLVARPEARVQVGARRIDVRAREAEGPECDGIWEALVARSPDYAQYRARTDRRIPLVVLEPRED
ncbi:MAG: nitroreductase family deazaflavin-dependent oxidoreductase [Myxococcota bacterium]